MYLLLLQTPNNNFESKILLFFATLFTFCSFSRAVFLSLHVCFVRYAAVTFNSLPCAFSADMGRIEGAFWDFGRVHIALYVIICPPNAGAANLKKRFGPRIAKMQSNTPIDTRLTSKSSLISLFVFSVYSSFFPVLFCRRPSRSPFKMSDWGKAGKKQTKKQELRGLYSRFSPDWECNNKINYTFKYGQKNYSFHSSISQSF